MKSNIDFGGDKMGRIAQKVAKGARRVATATTLAVASLSSQAQTPPPIPEIPAASIGKQNSSNALLPEGSKIGSKGASGQTEIFYSLQTSPGNYVVDISQWTGLSIPEDAKSKMKIELFDRFLHSLVLADAEFSKKKVVYIGMSGQARESLRLRIPEGMIDGYKIEVVYLPTTEDDGNKIVVSVIEPDDGKFYEYRGKVYDYENTKSGLMTKLGGKQEVIDAIDSHPLRTIGVVSAETLGVLTLGGLAGAGLAGRRRRREVAFWEERSKSKGFQMQLDEFLRVEGIVFERNAKNGTYTFTFENREYHLRSEYSPEEGGKIILESHGQYLTDDGHLHVIRGGGGNLPKVSLEIFTQFIKKQSEFGGAPTEPAGEGDMHVVDEVILRHVEIEDLPQVSNKLLGTVQRIDQLISQAGYVSGSRKLRFLHTGEMDLNAGSRICEFSNGEKQCEIYVNPEGLVQITVDGVKNPNDHDVGELKDLEKILINIFES